MKLATGTLFKFYLFKTQLQNSKKVNFGIRHYAILKTYLSKRKNTGKTGTEKRIF